MTRIKLYYDYLKSLRQADELEVTAENIKKLASNSMEEELNRIRTNWQGPASLEYNAKYNDIKSEMLVLSNYLLQTACTIRKVAQRVYETEIKALDIANRRTYK